MDLAAASPELALAFGALALLVVGVFRERDGHFWVSIGAIGAMAIAAIAVFASDLGRGPVFDGHFVADEFAAFAKLAILAFSAVAAAMALATLRGEAARFEYSILALISTLGMCMLVSASSVLSLYVALELTSLPLYAMAAFDRRSLPSAEAGLKYFVLGALASGIILYGASLIYGFTGALRFEAIARGFADAEGRSLSIGALTGLVFVIAGFAFKLAAAPFHSWAPDVYQGAPTPTVAFLASAPKLAAIALLTRLLVQAFGEWRADWSQVVALIAVASMLVGAFGALTQRDLKRLLAYSGVGHAGYALIGVAAGGETGVEAVLVYMTIYAITALAAFACVMALSRDGEPVTEISAIAGLARRRPGLAASFAALMLSLAGLPPLAGFVAKFVVFRAAIEAGLLWLAVIGLLSSVVAAYYYVRILKVMYFDAPTGDPLDQGWPPAVAWTARAGAFVACAFIVVPGPLMAAARDAAMALAP